MRVLRYVLIAVVCTVLSICAFGSSLQTIVGNSPAAPSGTVNFISPDNGLQSTVQWSSAGHINGPQDMGASISASYTNFAPTAGQNGTFYFFQENARFTDQVTLTGSGPQVYMPTFNFTVVGSTSGSHIDYAQWVVNVTLQTAAQIAGGLPGTQAFAVGCDYGCGPNNGGTPDGNFSLVDYANDAQKIPVTLAPGQYTLTITLGPRICLFGCLGNPAPVAGTILSGNADYNDTLILDSVSLAAGEGLTGTSGIDYGKLAPPSSVPEPTTLALLLTGFTGLAARARRRLIAPGTRK
jgi:hypothetical protein